MLQALEQLAMWQDTGCPQAVGESVSSVHCQGLGQYSESPAGVMRRYRWPQTGMEWPMSQSVGLEGAMAFNQDSATPISRGWGGKEDGLLILYAGMKPGTGTGLTFPDMATLFVETHPTVQRSDPIGSRHIHLLLDLFSAYEYFAYLHVPCVCLVPRRSEEAMDTLELEL